MKVETATHAKTHFGKVLETSLKERVVIEKSGRNVAVLLSFDEYQRMLNCEDQYWLGKAAVAQQEGFIGSEESTKFLQGLLDAED